jgi:molybdopterin-binding protein
MNRFRIDESFKITSVGFVFVGEIVRGSVKAGMSFEVPEAGHRCQLAVKSVEFVRLKEGREKIGLVVQDDDYLPGLGVGWTAELQEPRPDTGEVVRRLPSDAGSGGSSLTL